SAIDRQNAASFYNFVRFGRPVATTGTINSGATAQGTSPETAELKAEPKPFSRPGVSGIPLPNSYGVYALSDGNLTVLDLLPIKVPDSRIALSALITTPSQAHLPAGKVQFVVFRRDLANDAPDRVTVRVVAQVMRALTFGPGG